MVSGKTYNQVLLLIRKTAAILCVTIAFLHSFFTFKIKNLPKKAYKVYGRGIQEAN